MPTRMTVTVDVDDGEGDGSLRCDVNGEEYWRVTARDEAGVQALNTLAAEIARAIHQLALADRDNAQAAALR